MLEEFMDKLSAEMEMEEPFKAQIPGVYVMRLDEDISISLISQSSDRFTFSCTLGEAPIVGKEAFFTQLLLANLFGQGTRGAVLSLDINANELMLTRNIDHYIEYKEFRDSVEDFLNVVDFWKQELLTANSL